MRVGAYIDGLNLYYGGRAHCGRDGPGWRWLDLRLLCERLLAERRDWGDQKPSLHPVVYCTAFIDGQNNEAGRRRQGAYVRAFACPRFLRSLGRGEVRRLDAARVIGHSRQPAPAGDSSVRLAGSSARSSRAARSRRPVHGVVPVFAGEGVRRERCHALAQGCAR